MPNWLCGPLRRATTLLLLSGLLAGSGCQAPRQQLAGLAAQQHQQLVELPLSPFPLLLGRPATLARSAWLRVYIEGDGRAWLTPSQPSSDPSPHNLLVSRLAFSDPAPAVWLARPCQFVHSSRCSPRWWTRERYAPAVVDSLSAALDWLQEQHGVQQFELVGYSGGAALALLLAARRDDVVAVQTLAGNLMPRRWTDWQQLEPLTGSLEPLDQPERLRSLPQRHLYGLDDRVVPPDLAASYPEALGAGACVDMQALPGIDHHRGWEAVWQRWRSVPLPCR